MLIDLQIRTDGSISDQVRMIARAEEQGFDGAGIPDHLERGQDVYATLATAAMGTSRIALFPCVSNPTTRHPWVLANVANTMSELAPGRFRLVIGAGDSAVLRIGKRPAKLAVMSQAISDIRKLLHGESVSFGNATDEKIDGLNLPAPPVVMAAGARRMTELAGEVADEVFLLTGFDERIVAMSRRHLQEGAERSGRSLAGFPLTHYTVIRIEDDKEAAAEFGRSRLLGWLKMSFFKSGLAELGVPEDALAHPDDIPSAELDRLSEAFFLIGPIEKISERIQQIAKSGTIDRMVCVPSSAAGEQAAADELAAQVLPKVK